MISLSTSCTSYSVSQAHAAFPSELETQVARSSPDMSVTACLLGYELSQAKCMPSTGETTVLCCLCVPALVALESSALCRPSTGSIWCIRQAVWWKKATVSHHSLTGGDL